MTDLEFTNKVLSYKGKYSEQGLKKFIYYFTKRKHFSTFAKFDIGRRLATWFSEKRKESFKKKSDNPSKTDDEQFYNFLGIKAKIIKDVR